MKDKRSLLERALEEPVYATDGVEHVRTMPAIENGKKTFWGYIKTSVGESQVPADNELLYEVLTSGSESSNMAYRRPENVLRSDPAMIDETIRQIEEEEKLSDNE